MAEPKNTSLLFSFEDLGTKKDATSKAVAKLFAQAGTPVVSHFIDEKTKRVAGISTRSMTLSFADSQSITLAVKQSGDIYEVKMNNKLLPIKNQDDHKKAIKEMVNALDAGRSKFQAALARTVTVLPKTLKTAVPKIADSLQEQLNETLAAIDEADQRITQLEADTEALGETDVV